MSTITKNVGVKYNLAGLKVNIIDTSHLSNYFVISEFPDVLTAGKNLFAINGSSLLKSNSPIYLEILDAGGNALYYELAKSGYYNYTNVTDLSISVTVDQNTVPGMGQIYLVGTTTTNQTVKWSTNIKIDPSQENHSKVIFYNTPVVTTYPSIVYTLNQSISSTSMFSAKITGSVTGTSLTPKLYTDINSIDTKVTPISYTLTTTDVGITFSDNNLNTMVELYVDSITYIDNSNIITQSVNVTQSYLITDVVNTKTIVISSPFTYTVNTVDQIVQINHAKFSNQYVSIGYINLSEAEDNSLANKELVFQNQQSGSVNIFLKSGYLDVIYTDINTFTGNVYRHKVYRKSLNKASDFECIADEPLVSKNVLVDSITVNRAYDNLGRYYNQTHINRYYYTSSNAITLIQDSTNVLDSMTINCSVPNQNFDLSQYIIIKNNSSTGSYLNGSTYVPYTASQFISSSGFSYDTNFIDIYPDVKYSIGANLALTSSNENLDSRLSFYLTGSYNIDNVKQDPSYVNGIGLKLAEYVIPQGQKYKTFDSVIDETLFSFTNNYIGTLVIIPTNISSATLSKLNISTHSERGFSPDMFEARIPFDVTIKNEQFQLKFELFDINSNSVYSRLATIINFDPNGDTLVKNISNYTPIGTPTVSASYASTASYISPGTYDITASWANNVLSASYVKSASYSLSSSYVNSSSYSKSGSYGLSASYSLSSSYAYSASNSKNSISSSYSVSSSWAPTPPPLTTGSTYPITSSWSGESLTASSINFVPNTANTSSYVLGNNVSGDVTSALTASSINFIPDTSSYSNNSTSASYALSTSYADSSSYSLSASHSNISNSSSYALSGSYTDSSSYALTASYSDNSISSSYAISASWAPTPPPLVTGSTYPITSSWSNNSVTSSYSILAITASYELSSSHALNSDNSLSSSYALTASYAANVPTSVPTSSYSYTSSVSINSVSSSYALSASWAPTPPPLTTGSTYPITASWSNSSSYSLNSGTTLVTGAYYPVTVSWSDNSKNSDTSSYSFTSSYALNGGTRLTTGSTYPITSSWSNNSVTASFVLSSSYSNTSSYSLSSSYALSASYSLNSTSSSYASSASYGVNPAYVPYISASNNVILGSNSLSTTSGLISPKLYPLTDSTSSLGIFKADGITNILTVNSTNSGIGIGTITPTALLHIKAGTASTGSSPIKLTSGILMTAPEAGAIEFLTDKFYSTISTGTARKEFTLNDSSLTTGRIPQTTTNGRLVDSPNLTYTPTTGIQVISGATTSVPIISRLASSQTADGFQVQDTSANVISKVDVNGSGYFSGTGQSIIQTGMVINQSQDNTSNGVFVVKDSNGNTLLGGTGVTNTAQLGLVDTYNSIATVRNGLQVSYAKVDLTAQTDAIGATTVYSVPASGVGMYRVCWVATVTTAAGTSSILGGTNGFQVVYTDGDGSVVKTTVAGATSAANTTATTLSGAIVVYAKASTNIQYSMDYTSVGSPAMGYNLHVTVSKI